MNIVGLKTRTIQPPQDDIFPVIDEVITELPNKSVVCITSKIVGLHQGRTVKIDEDREAEQKAELVKQEADAILPPNLVPHGWVTHTLNDGSMVASAGIDASNSGGYFVLWPEDPSDFAKVVRQKLKEKFDLTDLGIIITDSHTTPLRYGTVGFAIGGYGLNPIVDYIGKKDLFGREFHVQQLSVYEGLASAANVVIGEGTESTPIAVITDLPEAIEFSNSHSFNESKVPRDQDLFKNMFKDYV